ncbi:phytoene/squalene synthase family protein [Sphingobium yanoikuyae]|uniref:phytoene/squalene synthase family protein n=1 Tax=Sphingobium yanoikuyae TaxID=13690 RepID=UPI0035AD7D64
MDLTGPPPAPPAGGRGAWNRPALVAHARDSIARGSKSFAMASKLFDRVTRERAWLLYAWCRKCDDIADGQDHGGTMRGVADGQARLSTLRVLTDAALRGEPTGDPAFDGFGVVMRECAIPHRYAHDLLEGFALDARDWRPRSEADMLRYCYHVAGAVGCMMAVLMGVDPEDEATLDRACDLGIAFQLANIARDISEDELADRCYLPVEWLVEMDMPPGEHMKPWLRPQLAMLGRRLANMAAAYEDSARHGTGALPARAAWAVLAAAGIYGDIAREVARRGEHAWDHRVVTPGREKLGWVIRAGRQVPGRARRWPAGAARAAGLWTRPTV